MRVTGVLCRGVVCCRDFLSLLMYSSLSSLSSAPTDTMSDSQSTTVSSLQLPPPPPTSVAPQQCIIKGQSWTRVEHAPIKRRGVDPSEIWDHGIEYKHTNNDNIRGWRCSYCNKNTIVSGSQDATSNARRHLRSSHKIHLLSSKKRSRDLFEAETTSSQPTDSPQATPVVKGIMTITSVEAFRYNLTRWMVNRHIPFVEVEDEDFRALLKCLNSAVDGYLVKTGNSIRDWVEDDFLEAKGLVVGVLARALSKIHISCDLWTSPNGYAMCGVAAHFIGHQGHVQAVLLALRKMTGAHSGEQIAEILIKVITEYEFARNLGVYIGDNADSNNTVWKATLAVLHPDCDSKASRSCCLGHIINLAAKAFIFSKNVNAFKAVVDGVNNLTPWGSPAMRAAVINIIKLNHMVVV